MSRPMSVYLREKLHHYFEILKMKIFCWIQNSQAFVTRNFNITFHWEKRKRHQMSRTSPLKHKIQTKIIQVLLIDEKGVLTNKNILFDHLLPPTQAASSHLLMATTKRQKRSCSYFKHKTWVSALPWQEQMSYKREMKRDVRTRSCFISLERLVWCGSISHIQLWKMHLMLQKNSNGT